MIQTQWQPVGLPVDCRVARTVLVPGVAWPSADPTPVQRPERKEYTPTKQWTSSGVIRAYLTQHPGSSSGEICMGTGLTSKVVSSVVKYLSSTGKIEFSYDSSVFRRMVVKKYTLVGKP